MTWLIVGYVVGGFAFWVAAFRVLASDPLLGVAASESKHEAIGAVLMSGFISLVMALFWPIVAVILAVWKYAVKPVVEKKEGDR